MSDVYGFSIYERKYVTSDGYGAHTCPRCAEILGFHDAPHKIEDCIVSLSDRVKMLFNEKEKECPSTKLP